MPNPIRNRDSTGTPPVHFYQEWINGDYFAWPHDPLLTPDQSSDFRETLKSVIYREGPVKAADSLFTRIRKCTAAQLGTFEKSLRRGNYHLDINSLDSAILDMGEHGSLAKLRALFPTMTWADFNDYLGVHESLSGSNMLSYAKDVVAWYELERANDTNGAYQTLMLSALQQCKLDVSKVIGVMKEVCCNGLIELDLIPATDTTVSLIYDLTRETANAKRQELADQFTKLHKGWGIAYPVALMVILANEKHGKTFDIPEVSALGYSAARIDVQIARVFNNTYTAKENSEHGAVSMARLVHSLYDQDDRFQFCIDGASAFLPKEKAPAFEIEGSIFQDVGQP